MLNVFQVKLINSNPTLSINVPKALKNTPKQRTKVVEFIKGESTIFLIIVIQKKMIGYSFKFC